MDQNVNIFILKNSQNKKIKKRKFVNFIKMATANMGINANMNMLNKLLMLNPKAKKMLKLNTKSKKS